jgi:hypothetical protein
MKKIFYLVVIASLLTTACQKTNSTLGDQFTIRNLLRDSVSSTAYETLDFNSFHFSTLSNGSLIRVGFKGKSIIHDAIWIYQDRLGSIKSSKIVHSEGGMDLKAQYPTYQGSIEVSFLNGLSKQKMLIVNGGIQSTQSATIVGTNAVGKNMACGDCTIPEVVVTSSYRNEGISWAAWIGLWSIFNIAEQRDYIAIDEVGGGGGGASAGEAITIDREAPEAKPAINAKEYTDCFGSIPDAGATCTITIAADIPVDGHPETFFNWSDASPGHVYIELYKAGSNGGLISQNIGFYPNSSWKVVSGTNIASKLADDAGHEYNARYTITVSASQFQAALTAVQTYSSYNYNVADFNCTDFALAVFNAAGPGLTIPRHQVPGFSSAKGSNTPQGLYEKISGLSEAGNKNAQTGGKAYGGTSHGPCK